MTGWTILPGLRLAPARPETVVPSQNAFTSKMLSIEG
jgi:hypothetical protein